MGLPAHLRALMVAFSADRTPSNREIEREFHELDQALDGMDVETRELRRAP